ncbi:MAG: hypothetical protein IJ588_11765 [Prevotella sp.]|nr:hypothetical protein [Prevotella sp.]
MNPSDRSSYRTNETIGQMFLHSCLGKLIILAGILLVLLFIAYLTNPSKQTMIDEMNDNIMQCMEANDSVRGDWIDDAVLNVGYIFTTADSTKVGQEWREAFDKYNRLEVYRHTFFSTAYIYNNLRSEGTRVGFGLFGVVIPTVNFNDFLLRTGPMHKGYDQKLIKTVVIPDNDLGTNPNIQEFHYKRNPDD